MTDAPEIIILQPCFTHGWEFPDRVKYETSIAIKYTRTDISQARVAELEGVVKWYGEQARLARLIHSEGDEGRHAINMEGGSRSRAALKAKP
jgi:hypothetical protein